jgi:hypothetical protein
MRPRAGSSVFRTESPSGCRSEAVRMASRSCPGCAPMSKGFSSYERGRGAGDKIARARRITVGQVSIRHRWFGLGATQGRGVPGHEASPGRLPGERASGGQARDSGSRQYSATAFSRAASKTDVSPALSDFRSNHSLSAEPCGGPMQLPHAVAISRRRLPSSVLTEAPRIGATAVVRRSGGSRTSRGETCGDELVASNGRRFGNRHTELE